MRHRLARRLIVVLILLGAALVVTPAAAVELDRTVSVQGMVTTSSGVPANGTFDMDFRLFTAKTGGAAVWSQQTAGVDVAGGVFEVDLGPIPAGTLAPHAILWVETVVEGNALPRRPLRATPFALVAQTAHASEQLTCSGCVVAGHLADGAVTPDAVAPGSYGISITGSAASANLASTAVTAQSFTGPLTGDVTGTQGATHVTGLQGVGVSTAAPSNNQVLKYDASKGQWGPSTDKAGSGTVKSVGTGQGLKGGPITATGTVELRLSGGGGLSKTLGPGGNELGVAPGGITQGMVAGGTYGIDISGKAASAGTATSFSGPLAGDVTGTQGATAVHGLRGVALSGAPPAGGQVLKYNASTKQWEPSADAAGAGGTVKKVNTGSGLTGGPITSSGTVGLKLDPAGGLSSTQGSGGNALGIAPDGIAPGMVSNGTYGINISGNAATATNATKAGSATKATSFTGSLKGDVTGKQGATVVEKLRGVALATSTPSNGQVLKYDSGTGLWGPGTDSTGSAGVTKVTASSPLASTGGTKPNITLGVVPTSKGGTGITGAPSVAGQVLRATGAGKWGIAAIQAGDIPAGSGSYIQNGSGAQSATFNITGNGTASRFYASDWFRATGKTGLYFETYGGGVYMKDTTWVRTYNDKSFYSAATIKAGGKLESPVVEGTTKMSSPIYFDMDSTSYYLDPSSTSKVNQLQASKVLDRDNTAYYLDPASTSKVATLHASKIYDLDNTGYYLDPAGKSVTNDMRASIYYDRSDANFYVDPASTSKLNKLHVSTLYDRDNTAYYLNPAGTTKVSTLYVGGKTLGTYIRDYINTNCYVYFGWRDNCSGCNTKPYKYGRTRGSSSGCSTTGSDGDCVSQSIYGQSVLMYGLNTDGGVDGNDKFWIGFRCF